jgi:hypothetical protein
MHRLIEAGGMGYSLCPTCGTVKIAATNPATAGPFRLTVYVPKLVERCRELEKELGIREPKGAWVRLGIHEAINTPGNRPGEK